MHLSGQTTSSSASASRMILGAFAIGQAVQTNNGVIHPIALAWIGVAMIAMLSALLDVPLRAFRWIERLHGTRLLSVCIAVQFGQTALWALRWGPDGTRPWSLGMLSIVAAGLVVMLAADARRETLGFVMIAAGFALTAMGVIHSSPGIGIDVFYFQDESASALLRGLNPYTVRFRDIYFPETGFYGDGASINGWLLYSFPYPPLMLFMVAPAKLLAGDVRYAHLCAMLASAILIAATLRSRIGMLSAVMMLLLPRNLLTLQVAWTEPVVLFWLSALFVAARQARRWLWLAVGGFLASKQYSVLLIPLMPLLFNAPLRARPQSRTRALFPAPLIAGAAIAFATIVPFLIISPTAFVRSVALWQFRQPFFEDALSYSTLIWRMTGIKLGAAPGFFAAGLCVWVGYRFASRSVAGFSGSITLLLLAFFAFNKQAFCNYYTLVAALACWTGGLLDAERLAANTNSTEDAISPLESVALAA